MPQLIKPIPTSGAEGELLPSPAVAAKVVGAIPYTSSDCIGSAFGAETVDIISLSWRTTDKH